ncbi:alkaline phosphatase D family protein [bacterium]|nr:alkaline phosphatase D family protein [bacterium]
MFALTNCLPGFAQMVKSGPMLGYNTLTETAIWLQTDVECTSTILYWETNHKTDSINSMTQNESGNTAHVYEFHLSGLKPGTDYSYKLKLNETVIESDEPYSFRTELLWQYRTDPPEFNVALGSCSYINEKKYDRPNKTYGGDYQIYNSIEKKHPEIMLWMGDNIYLREVDWSSKSGYIHRYEHTRSIPEIQSLLSSTHNYAIWDDHDFGPNDANGSWIHKDWALETFDLFWANPTTGTSELDGITTAFSYNDIDFYLLDNRFQRTSDNLSEGELSILGNEQIDWLIQNLKYSRAPFKLVAVGGQVLNTAPVYETHAVYGDERKYLIRRIIEEEIEGVIFLTGDRHHSELSRYEDESGAIIYDLTVSPLTAGTHANDDENNKLRVPNTLVNERNFGILNFSGERGKRQMKISIFDSVGELIWTKIIDQT